MSVAPVNKSLMAYGLGRKEEVGYLGRRKDSDIVAGAWDLPGEDVRTRHGTWAQVPSHMAECRSE